MNGQGAAVKLAIIDASRRNPYERRFRSVAAGLAPINVPKDGLVIYSAGARGAARGNCGRAKPVHERVPQGAALARHLGRGIVHAHALGVSRASEAEQVPWVASSLLDLVYFVHTTADRRGGR